MLAGYLVVSGGARCGSAKASVRGITHQHNPHQSATCCAVCNVSQGGPWEVEHRDSQKLAMKHNLDLICTGSCPHLFVPGFIIK